MNKEHVQNLAILFLVLSSLVLLSIRFELFMMTGAEAQTVIADPAALRSFVRPESIAIRSGAENTIKVSDRSGDYYAEISEVLGPAIAQRTGIKEITRSEYRAASSGKSLLLQFAPVVDERLLYGSLFWREGTIGDVGSIKEIVMAQSGTPAVYIRTDQDSYYALATNATTQVASFDAWSASGRSRYYTIAERFPSSSDSDVLIADEVRLPSYTTASLFSNEQIAERLRSIFGAKYDYANRISEADGSLVLNYDYGRELIKITKDGKVFYHNEDARALRKRTSLPEASAAAMRFIEALTQDKSSYVIERATEKSFDGGIGYEFEIGVRANGVRVSLKNDMSSIRISVLNGTVLSMEGLFRKISLTVDNNLAFDQNAMLYLIEQNIDYIRERESFADLSALLQKIRSAEYAYLYAEDYSYTSCYKMVIGETTFFFRIADAQVVRT